MDYALSLRCGQRPSTFSQELASYRLKTVMISAGSWLKPHIFFKNNSCLPIFPPSNVFYGASKVLRSPKLGRDALVVPVKTLAHWRISQGKGDGGIATRMTGSAPSTLGVSFVLACVLGIFCFASMLVLSPRKARGAFFPVLSTGSRLQQPRTMTNGPQIQPLNARFVLKKFMKDVMSSSAPPTKPIPAPKDVKPVDNITAKENALRKMKVGNISPDLILEQMKSEVRAFRDRGPEQKLQTDLSLLEVMILLEKDKDPPPFVSPEDILYKDEFEEVLNSLSLNPLSKDPQYTNPGVMFYKAIGYTHIDEKEKARDAWKQFIDNGFE